jgi:hypothetical protein
MPFASSGGPDNEAIRELRDSVNKLRETMDQFNKETSAQTERMLFLTYTTTFLTAVMLLGLVVQVILVFKGNG